MMKKLKFTRNHQSTPFLFSHLPKYILSNSLSISFMKRVTIAPKQAISHGSHSITRHKIKER